MIDPATARSDVVLATDLARQAGELLRGHYGVLRRSDAARKGGFRRDLVSRADLDAEQLLLAGIPPGDGILAEESGSREPTQGRRWIIDPLDGTVNFLHGIPFWCVSIAVEREDWLSAAVVHAPALAQTFTAAAGEGCSLNGEPVRVSSTEELADALLATGLAYRRNALPDDNLDNFVTLALAAAGLRRLGSAALDLAYTAAGRFDGFWELHLNPWDVAAGTLLVCEAGGRVSDFHGREDLSSILHSRHIIASNCRLHAAIAGRLAPLKALD